MLLSLFLVHVSWESYARSNDMHGYHNKKFNYAFASCWQTSLLSNMLTQNMWEKVWNFRSCTKSCTFPLWVVLWTWSFFSLMTRQTAKSMQILFCFFRRPFAKKQDFVFFESSTLFPCDMLSQHIWEASTFEWTAGTFHLPMLCSIVQGNTRD